MEKYTKVRVLGKGSFGSAILIKRRSDNALFVIKEVFLGKLNEKERTEARQECRMLQKLNHPNIVRYVEHFENRNNLYIVMEYCDDGDLHGKIKRGPMNESRILYYYSQVCLAMEYLHSRHILHRDIKTMNVFLMKNGSVKLGDFGIATVLRNTMGMASTVCGTPYYFSPEICKNKPYNNKSDVWALGVLLYELATGRHPFDGNSMQQLMQRIVRGTYNPLPSHFSREFRKMVDWCLQKDPARRPSIRQMLAFPIVQRSLERLEEDLMLATQCRIRLKDIIEYDAAAENIPCCEPVTPRPQETPRGEQRHRQEPHPPEMSPGKMAAMALAGQHNRQQQQHVSAQAAMAAGPPAVDPAAQRHADHAGLLAPKPNAAHAAADHGRLEIFRREAPPQCKRPLADIKQALPFSPYQRPHFQQVPCQPQYVANPYKQLMQQHFQQLQEKQRQPHQPQPDAQRQMQKNNEAKRGPDCKQGEGFEDRIKRINAIVERYAKDVDPKTLNTIHAYMKRKQEEYLQRQKEQKERLERRRQLRKQELLKVIEQQNRIARGEKVRKGVEQKQHAQKPVAEMKPLNPGQPAVGDRNAYPSPYKVLQSPPRGAQYPQQQNPVFGRDPRCVRAAPKESNPVSGGRNGNAIASPYCPNYHNAALREALKGPAPPVDSPGIPDNQRVRQLYQQPGMQPRGDGDSAARGVAASPRVVVYRDVVNLNDNPRRAEPSQLNAGQLEPKPQKGKRTADPSVHRHPLGRPKEPCPLVIPTADQVFQKQQPLRRQLKQQPLTNIVSAPLLPTPRAESPVAKAIVNHHDIRKLGSAEGDLRSPFANGTLGRRNSAPSISPSMEVTPSKNSPLNEKEAAANKCHVRPTTASGFVAEGASATKDLPALRVTSPFSRLNLEDLPADVKVRRELQQQAKQHALLSQLKGDFNLHPAKRNDVVCGRSKSCAPEFVNARHKGGSPILYRRKDGFLPSNQRGGCSKSQEINGDDDSSKNEIGQPMLLAPLQCRAGVAAQGQCLSPAVFSMPVSPSAAPHGQRRQTFQRGGASRNNHVPQATPPDAVPSMVVAKINPKVHQPVPTREKKPDNGRSPAFEESIHTPILVDICYGVAPTSEEALNKKAAFEGDSTPVLPSINDVTADPPDVAQQWRNFVDKNANGKAPYRALCSHLVGMGFHNNMKLPGHADEMAVFQKVDGPRPCIPSTLEVLVGTSVSKKHSPVTSSSGSDTTAFDAETRGRERCSDELPSLTSIPCIISPTSVACAAGEGCQSKPYGLQKDSDAEETGGFIGLEDDPRASRDDEGRQGSTGSVQVLPEASLDGYLSMLDHLRGLLYNNPSQAKKASAGNNSDNKNVKEREPSLLSAEEVRNLVDRCERLSRSEATRATSPNQGAIGVHVVSLNFPTSSVDGCEENKEGESRDDESDLDDEEDLDEAIMEVSDVEFGDDVPLTAPQCAGISEAYQCDIENDGFLPRVVNVDSQGNCSEGGNDARTERRKEEKETAIGGAA